MQTKSRHDDGNRARRSLLRPSPMAEYLPVALAFYAAAAIAEAPAGPTGWKAFVMAMSGFIIPFAVVMHPGSLLTGVVDVADAIWGFFNVFTAFIPLGAAITGYLFRNLGKGWRTYFAVVGVANVLPGVFISAVTFAALAVPGYLMWRGERRRPVQTSSIPR